MRHYSLRAFCCLLLVPVLAFGQAPQSSEDMKRMHDSLKREIEQMREALARTEKKITELEAQNQAMAAKPPADPAQTGELKERVALVEQEMVTNKVADSRRLEIHSYGEVNFESFENTRSVFDPRILELIVTGRPVNRLRYFAEIEFERAAGLGTRRGGQLGVEQGWFELTLKDWARPRAGVVNVPFGYYNQNHFVTQQDHVDKPLLGNFVVPGTWSDVGFGMTGTGGYKSLNFTYESYLLQGLQQGINNRGLADGRGPFGADNNGNKALAAQFRVTSGPYYRGGVSFYRGHFDNLGRQAITGVAFDGKWGRGPVQVMGEYDRFNTSPGLVAAPHLYHGFLTEGKYTWRPAFLRNSLLGEGFEDPKIEWVARFENAWIDQDAGTHLRDERRLTVGVNYRPSEHFVLKSGYQFNSSKNLALQRGNLNGFLSSIAFYF